MKSDFLNAALTEVKTPEILINMVSRRVRQLGIGYRPLVPVDPRWSFMDVALKEIAEKKLSFENLSGAETPKARIRRTSRQKRAKRG